MLKRTKRSGSKKTVKKAKNGLPKVLFVVGPTSSGKTDLAVKIAKEFKGEIINADARQIYKQVDIGTGKPKGRRGEYRKYGAFMYKGVPHYLMDFLPPTEIYSAAEWREAALKAIKGIVRRGHLPIVVGGTGLYITAIVDNLKFPNVEPQPALRAAYEKKDLDDLVSLLLLIDPGAGTIVDLKNKRRVIRALEVITFTGEKFSELRKKGNPLIDAYEIGIERTPEELNARIEKAVEEMVENGLVHEVRELMKQGVPGNAPALTSLGYREFMEYFKGKLTLEEAVKRLKKLTRDYAKRQRTWFKRDTGIHWVKSDGEAMKLVRKWLRAKS